MGCSPLGKCQMLPMHGKPATSALMLEDKGLAFFLFLPYLYPGSENRFPHASLAQLVEQLIRNQQVKSSSLLAGSNKFKGLCVISAHEPFLHFYPQIGVL